MYMLNTMHLVMHAYAQYEKNLYIVISTCDIYGHVKILQHIGT